MEDEVEDSEEAGGRHANTEQLALLLRIDEEEGNGAKVPYRIWVITLRNKNYICIINHVRIFIFFKRFGSSFANILAT